MQAVAVLASIKMHFAPALAETGCMTWQKQDEVALCDTGQAAADQAQETKNVQGSNASYILQYIQQLNKSRDSECC